MSSTNTVQLDIPLARHGDVYLAFGVVGVLVVLVLPLPAALLDVLLATNITLALGVLLVTMYLEEPLEFSAFPSLLLFATLLRLSLNVASTRLILLYGFAGSIISAFGNFVVGGNYVVGAVIFVILVVIQFIVITKGSGRIAEVAARFTLDAMPGKQMSIDADLNAGLIDDTEARQRRRKIESEANFYGAMDGASKFVRGDAIAGIIITLINVIGGLAIGVGQKGMPMGDALKKYTLLTIGDGLVTQIPALIVATSAGIIVTRAASRSNLGQDLTKQLLLRPRALTIASVMLVFFGLTPGLPTIPFLALAVVTGLLAAAAARQIKQQAQEELPEPDEKPELSEPEQVERLLHVDPLALELGYGLISLVDESRGGDLLSRITMIRRRCATELGVVIPLVHIRDNMQLDPNDYVIRIKGLKVAEGSVMLGQHLAINPGNVEQSVPGTETTEPAFGLPARWISEAQKARALSLGYTVVDAPSVIATHLTETIKGHAADILSRQDVQRLLDNIKEQHPAVVDELVPGLLTLGGVHRVLQNLLREQVSVRDLTTILETLADYATTTKSIDFLTEYVRHALAGVITDEFTGDDGQLATLTLDPALEQYLTDSMRNTEHGATLALPPEVVSALIERLEQETKRVTKNGQQPVLLCRVDIRRELRNLMEQTMPGIAVLSYNEITPATTVNNLGTISLNVPQGAAPTPNLGADAIAAGINGPAGAI